MWSSTAASELVEVIEIVLSEVLVRHKDWFLAHSGGGQGQQQVCQEFVEFPLLETFKTWQNPEQPGVTSKSALLSAFSWTRDLESFLRSKLFCDQIILWLNTDHAEQLLNCKLSRLWFHSLIMQGSEIQLWMETVVFGDTVRTCRAFLKGQGFLTESHSWNIWRSKVISSLLLRRNTKLVKL